LHLTAAYYAFTLIFVLGLMSPGPDFVLVTKNSLRSLSAGRWSACGIALGILVHVTYCLVGIGIIVARSIALFSMIKLAGAAYLIYLGSRALLSKEKAALTPGLSIGAALPVISPTEALRMGFVTNVLNPKVTVLFVSLFTQVIGPKTPMALKALCGSEMFLFTLIWFLFVSTVFSYVSEIGAFKWILKHAEKAAGVVMIAFGVRLAFARSH
jgi:RhtB (resistance to homoserine/threonine) family protein